MGLKEDNNNTAPEQKKQELTQQQELEKYEESRREAMKKLMPEVDDLLRGLSKKPNIVIPKEEADKLNKKHPELAPKPGQEANAGNKPTSPKELPTAKPQNQTKPVQGK